MSIIKNSALTHEEQSIVGWEIVTADGQIRHVDAAKDPELAVALRGSGSQLGNCISLTSISLSQLTIRVRHCN